MTSVGVRALKQNASAVVAQVVAGEVVTITDRGRPVAQIVPLHPDTLTALTAAGRVRPASREWADLPSPATGAELSPVLAAMREDERF